MNKLFKKITIFLLPFYFFIFLSSSWAPPLDEGEDVYINSTHYVSYFTIPSDEAVQLLEPHWKHGFKRKLSEMISVSQSTLKALVDEKKTNKALTKFNESLIENPDVWKLFSIPLQIRIILGELVRQTSLKDVAEQLEVETGVLESFQADPENSETVICLSKVSFKKWPIQDHEEPSPTMARISATFDGRAIPGGMVDVSSFRAFSLIGGQWDVLYGSSDRNPGYRPPDQTPLLIKQERHLSQFRAGVQGLDAADPNVSPERLARQISRLSLGESPTVGVGEVYVQSSRERKRTTEPCSNDWRSKKAILY